MAAGEANSLVAWVDDHAELPDHIVATRMGHDGTVLDGTGLVIANTYSHSASSPAVAWDGTNFLVVWVDYRSGLSDPYAARVTPGGEVLDPGGFPISTAPQSQGAPSVVWTGRWYFVVWAQAMEGNGVGLFGARVASSGRVLDPEGVPLFTDGRQKREPRVAWNGSTYLVVWQQGRFGTIRASLVSARGVVLGEPINVAKSDDFKFSHRVASDGDQFLVAWGDQSHGGECQVCARRISRDGEILDRQVIVLDDFVPGEEWVGLAWSGSSYLVAWPDSPSGVASDIHARRISSTGRFLDEEPIEVARSAPDQLAPAVASTPSGFVVVWSEDSGSGSDFDEDIAGARVSGEGAVLDPHPIVLSRAANSQYTPAAASNGRYHLVAWVDGRAGSYDIYAARVTGEGRMLDRTGISIGTSPEDEYSPAVAWNGTSFLVAWQEERRWRRNTNLRLARVAPDGTLLDDPPIKIPPQTRSARDPAAAAFEDGFLVVWREGRPLTGDILAARLANDGTLLDPEGFHIASSDQGGEHPAVSWDGRNALVTWSTWRPGTWEDLFAARIGPDGSVMDDPPILVSAGRGDERNPAVAWGGATHLVVWQARVVGGWEILGSRIGPDGTVQDPVPISVTSAAEAQIRPAVEWGGSAFVVVWQDGRDGEPDVWGARVDAAGTVLDAAGVPLSRSRYGEGPPALSGRTGESTVLAYERLAPEATYRTTRVFFRALIGS